MSTDSSFSHNYTVCARNSSLGPGCSKIVT
uniref:Uncharacterized protein n=1 Tax=Anguilla anguilla TaxID=7936 RepID=A0A0E9VB23_ANGAN